MAALFLSLLSAITALVAALALVELWWPDRLFEQFEVADLIILAAWNSCLAIATAIGGWIAWRRY